MNFQLDLKNKQKIIWALIGMVLAIGLWIPCHYPIPGAIGFVIAFYLVNCIEIKWNENGSLIVLPILFLMSSIVTFLSVQRIILTMERFVRIPFFHIVMNILCYFAVYLIVFAITARPRLTIVVTHVAFVILALANNFVYQFREDEIYPGSLMRISAINAQTEGYNMHMTVRAVLGILVAAVFIALIMRCRFEIQKKHALLIRIISFLAAAVFSLIVALNVSSVSTETWRQKGSYHNGYFLNFLLAERDQLCIHKPKGYSAKAVDEIAQQYVSEDVADQDANEALDMLSTGEQNENPVVITIMSEAFSDLRNLGDFNTNKDFMPFYDSLQENTTKGFALASVFGAKTPNSEWEYLTGNTMGFMPGGSVVYQQFLSEEPTSLVSNFKNKGYTCVGMHPYYSGGFSRTTNYTNMGFDEKYFLDSFDETRTIRGYVSDEQLFDKIIERYEEAKGNNEDLFIHAVTMQNHRPYYGYYYALHSGNYTTIRTDGLQYEDVNNYLSLLNKSDQALEKLITYFQQQDRKVVIVIFGDHNPSLNNDFYTSLNGIGLSGLNLDELEELYKIPFMVWTNFDSDEEYVECTSLNYLSTIALEKAGIALPAYNQFLKDMQEVIPAMNSRGYYSLENQQFMYLKEAKGEEAEWLKKYEQLQYNEMFDAKHKNEKMFPYLVAE